jgi:hypothetical protein
MSGDPVAPQSPYVLGERAALERGRATAAFAAVATVMPPLLVMLLIGQLDLAPVLVVLPIASLILALGAVRGVVGYRSVVRRLRSFEASVDAGALWITSSRARVRVPLEAVARIVEIDGRLGGLRIEVTPAPDLPVRIDVPRGGERFADLKNALAACRPIERAPRRRRASRVVFGALIVLAIFFAPFVVDDLGARSRVAACVVILALWVAMRAALARV